jgi:hypothetical protein
VSWNSLASHLLGVGLKHHGDIDSDEADESIADALPRRGERTGVPKMSMFSKATKSKARLRLAISGPSGSGKTMTSLLLAKHLGSRVAVVDTERGSASKYAGDVADFQTLELDMFTVENYLRAIKGAADEGFDVLVIDSLSHAWSGRGGILEQADKMGGKFSAWAKLTPLQQKLIDSILSYPGHVIVTMRSKMAYEVSVEEGKNGTKQTKVEKLGLAPVQRDDVSYEFDVMLDMNDQNVAHVTKSRCSAIANAYIDKPGAELAATLTAWLSDGVDAPAKRPTLPPAAEEKPAAHQRSLAERLPECVSTDSLLEWIVELNALDDAQQKRLGKGAFLRHCQSIGLEPEMFAEALS